MGVRCSVFIPEGVSPSPSTLNLLRQHGADVVIVGKIYRDALSAAQNAVKREDNASVRTARKDIHKIHTGLHSIMVPAYDHPTVWEGHASMVEEIAGQLGKPPGAIICRSVRDARAKERSLMQMQRWRRRVDWWNYPGMQERRMGQW